MHSNQTNEKNKIENLSGKSLFGRLMYLCGLLGILAFAGCTETSEEPLNNEVQRNQPLTLLPSQEKPIIINASSSKSTEGTAFQKGENDRGRFEITLKFITPVTERQLEVFEAAKARWARTIIGDVPSITLTEQALPSAFIGFPPVADIGETIDDIIIEVALAPIDGPGNILGQAGPRFVRNVDNLTLSGVMFFDIADLDLLEQFDLFEEVILHEMGHVLGIGTLWGFNRSLIDGTFEEPYFTGKKGNIHWRAEGGTDFLPIENMGGGGTRFSHWRELVLDNELMTGFLNLGENPLSRITAGSLRDLGYQTAMVGEQYDLDKGTPGVDISAMDEDTEMEGIFIADKETLLEPVGVVVVD